MVLQIITVYKNSGDVHDVLQTYNISILFLVNSSQMYLTIDYLFMWTNTIFYKIFKLVLGKTTLQMIMCFYFMI